MLSSIITKVLSTPESDLPITKGQNIVKFNIRQRGNVTKYLFYSIKVTANLMYTNNKLELTIYWRLLWHGWQGNFYSLEKQGKAYSQFLACCETLFSWVFLSCRPLIKTFSQHLPLHWNQEGTSKYKIPKPGRLLGSSCIQMSDNINSYASLLRQ